MKKSMILLSLWAFLFAVGCKEEEGTGSECGVETPIELAARSYAFEEGSQGVLLPENSEVGVFVHPVKRNAPLLCDNALFVSTNVPSGDLRSGSAEEWCFPLDGSFIDVMAYAPYSASLTNYLYPVDLNSTDAPLMFGRSINLNATSGKVSIRLYPVLSHLNFRFAPSAGFSMSDLQGMKVTLKGVLSTASFNLLTGLFQPSAPIAAPSKATRQFVVDNQIEMNLAWEANQAFAQTSVIPLSPTASLSLFVELPALGKSYTYLLSESIAKLSSSVQYNLNVVVGAGELKVAVSESSPIIGWTPDTPIYW